MSSKSLAEYSELYDLEREIKSLIIAEKDEERKLEEYKKEVEKADSGESSMKKGSPMYENLQNRIENPKMLGAILGKRWKLMDEYKGGISAFRVNIKEEYESLINSYEKYYNSQII